MRATQPAPAWSDRPLAELIDHILINYHEPLRRELPALLEAAQRVERVHARRDECPRGLAEHLRQVAVGLEDHMAKEERVLFPALVAGHRGAGVHMPIRVMMAEHDDHAVELARIRELTRDFTLPEEACGTWRGLYAGLERLEAELMEHINLENTVLFPRALAG